MREFCQNIAFFEQPLPFRHEGGDCFACALTAALRHLYPGKDITFDECFDCFTDSRADGSVEKLNHWPLLKRAFRKMEMRVGLLELETDIVAPQFDLHRSPGAWFDGIDVGLYMRRLEGYLQAGWIVFAVQDIEGRGPALPDGSQNRATHLVLLDGVRRFCVKIENGYPSTLRRVCEVRVVCSVRGAYWIDTETLIRKFGVAGWLLCRPEK